MHDSPAENLSGALRSDAEPSTAARLGRFLSVLTELSLIAVVIWLFEIESSRHLLPVFCFAIAGFAVHSWLPPRLRTAFFAAMSLAGIVFVLGGVNGGCVLGVGAGLIAVCYLPASWPVRLTLLSLIGAALCVARSQSEFPFWPVLGSCFMFRLACFVHEARRTGKMPPLSSAAAYFFMLPNACFPLFPIVDYKIFRESCDGAGSWDVVQRGVAWMVRGLLHLLLYRCIRSYWVPEFYELHRFSRVVAFMLTNYALYVQVSGQFHLITGVLHLFGWDLPRTHNRYFLASSFSDIWRRINIYWKDFLAKFVFYPLYYALRRRGASSLPAVTASAFLVFVATWLLHSWQTFWLLGRFPLSLNDACLWIGVGFAVAINVAWESRASARGSSPARFAALRLSLQIVAMQLLVSLFWACWTKPGFLALVWGSLRRPNAGHETMIVAIWALAAAAMLFVWMFWVQPRLRLENERRTDVDFGTSVKLHVAGLGVVAALASPWCESLLPPRWSQSVAEFRRDPVSRELAGERLLSYYEDLNRAVIQAGPLMNAVSPRRPAPREQAEGFNKVSRAADPYQQLDLIAGLQTEIEGKSFSVNQFGMRDRTTLTLDKPVNAVRIAVVGSSVVMGYGVADDEVFCRAMEEDLNRERDASAPAVEVLNFGVGKQWAPQRLVRIQRKALAFQPDVLLYLAHQDEFRELASHTGNLISRRLPLPSRHLQSVADRAMVSSGMAEGAIQSQLQRYERELLGAIYQTIVEECAGRKIVPVWIYLPIPGELTDDVLAKLKPLAESAGFRVWDLSDWTTTREGLFSSPDNPHPNERGHRLIATRLLRAMHDDPVVRARLGLPGKHLAAGARDAE